MWLLTLFKNRAHQRPCTPLMLIAGIRYTLYVACKCVCHYWGGENLQMHHASVQPITGFVQIESSTSERVWRECDKETLWCFAAIFRSTPIWRITAVDVGGNILLETYCCALNAACALQLSKGRIHNRSKAWSCSAGRVHKTARRKENTAEKVSSSPFFPTVAVGWMHSFGIAALSGEWKFFNGAQFPNFPTQVSQMKLCLAQMPPDLR